MTSRRLVPTALAVGALAAPLWLGAGLAPASATAPGTTTAPGTATASTSTATSSALAGVPRAGQCYRYSVAQSQASASPTAPVACSAPHTAWTFFVGRFSGRAARITTPLSPALDRPAMAACYARREAVLGTAVHLTRVRFAWFLPTPAQWSRGARWFRCDAVAVVGTSSYGLLPPRLPSVVADPVARESLRACARTANGAVVPCTLRHDAKAVAWVRLGSATTVFPGPARILPLVTARCTAALAALPGAPALAWSTWPVASSWSAGHRVATCYAADPPPAPTG